MSLTFFALSFLPPDPVDFQVSCPSSLGGKKKTTLTWHFLFPSLSFCLSLGVEEKLDKINKLKVKGLLLGPLHTVQADQPNTLKLEEIHPSQGTKEALISLVEKAQRKGRLSTKVPFYHSCSSLDVVCWICVSIPLPRHFCGAWPDSKLPRIFPLVHRRQWYDWECRGTVHQSCSGTCHSWNFKCVPLFNVIELFLVLELRCFLCLPGGCRALAEFGPGWH